MNTNNDKHVLSNVSSSYKYQQAHQYTHANDSFVSTSKRHHIYTKGSNSGGGFYNNPYKNWSGGQMMKKKKVNAHINEITKSKNKRRGNDDEGKKKQMDRNFNSDSSSEKTVKANANTEKDGKIGDKNSSPDSPNDNNLHTGINEDDYIERDEVSFDEYTDEFEEKREAEREHMEESFKRLVSSIKADITRMECERRERGEKTRGETIQQVLYNNESEEEAYVTSSV